MNAPPIPCTARASVSISGDVASPNMLHLGNSKPATDRVNTDLAFWGYLAAAGNYYGFRHVDVGPLDPEALVRYRLGMANLAGFVRRLPETARRALIEDAVSRLGPSPPLRPAVLMLRASMPVGGRRAGDERVARGTV